ncbi:MAG: peptidylprolyl isomerase [Chitinophagales bacterium]|nr:peptidylprolyl isomerase [Bacteroidota bacterium]MCB9043713.1 peptidylprolyl isomerase [Chitinophagales bacterium]
MKKYVVLTLILSVSIFACKENPSPTAKDDNASTDQNAAVRIDVLANDTDSLGMLDPASLKIVAKPANGVSEVVEGKIQYTPKNDFSGNDTFTYVICDNGEPQPVKCDTATVTVAIEKLHKLLLSTDLGDITLVLYNKTPKHRDNFLKLVQDGFYDGTLFHRIISQFMIQGGDPDSKNAKAGQNLGSGGPGYTVPAEFVPEYFHKRGALAAARQGDQVNPQRASSGSQFYIVQGRPYNTPEIAQMEQSTGKKISPDRRKVYETVGGTPFLDDQYTVFGEVIDGMEVVDKIALEPKNRSDRPLRDIKMTIKEIE